MDIGGSNFRVGLVRPHLKKAPDLSAACLWESEIWRHRDDKPAREAAIDRLCDMLKEMLRKAEKRGLAVAPFIGVGCPGHIETDGSIARGAQNLPGNWESNRFNLPDRLREAIPEIGGHPTVIVMHNDAVVQGLSQVPWMGDVRRWGVLTIGTGLGNARFTNRARPAGDSSRLASRAARPTSAAGRNGDPGHDARPVEQDARGAGGAARPDRRPAARRIETPCGEGSMVWRVWGDGPPLVLLHGGSGSWRHWVRNMEPLARGRRVICPELPGLGESAMPPPAESPAPVAAVVRAGLARCSARHPLRPLRLLLRRPARRPYRRPGGGELRSVTLVGAGALGLRRQMTSLVKVRSLVGEARIAAHRHNLAALMFADPAGIDPLALAMQEGNTRPPASSAAASPAAPA